jgi:predicted transcriptional regulator
MKLNILNIIFLSHDEFKQEIKSAIMKSKTTKNLTNSISFDSLDSFNKIMTPKKLQLIMAIARLNPESINHLAKLLSREYAHVFKECKNLQTLGFIKLEEVGLGLKKQSRPMLSFNYDFIRVKAPIEEIFPITEKTNRILLDVAKAS